jgi:hypothetical protein
MSISYIEEKIKRIIWALPNLAQTYFRPICIILLAFLCLGVWQIHAENIQKTGLKIEKMVLDQNNSQTTDVGLSQTVIGSKTGSKYYFPWCGALKRIKLENQISFASPELAQAAGYTPASNCKGVK